jgi:hypothetical protein
MANESKKQYVIKGKIIMYGDDIELEHSSCCICRIPEDWLPNIK